MVDMIKIISWFKIVVLGFIGFLLLLSKHNILCLKNVGGLWEEGLTDIDTEEVSSVGHTLS